MRRKAIFAASLFLFSVGRVQGQADFGDLKLKRGQVVYVTEPSGAEVSGRLKALSPLALTIEGYQFGPSPGLKIQRRGDPLWDGAAWGLGVGLLAGMIIASGECGIDWSAAHCMADGGMWGAGIGFLIDWAHVGRTLVFLGTGNNSKSARSLQLTPRFNSSSRMAALGLSF